MASSCNRASYANVVINSAPVNLTPDSQDQNNNSSTNFESTSIESNSHPLFLHNNDHPGLILITKKLTGTENFEPWKRSMHIALSAKNKLVIVNGSFPKPAENSSMKSQYDRVNDMVITWILNTVSDEISDGMNFVHSAAEVWEELHDRFSGVNGHRIYQILRDVHSLEQENRSVEIHFHKLKNLWDEYGVLEPTVNCVCGAHKVQEEREQRRKLMQFLMGLHDSYAIARGQILMMNPLPSVTQAFSLIKQDEKQRQGYLPSHSSYSDGASLIAAGRNVNKFVNYHKDSLQSGMTQFGNFQATNIASGSGQGNVQHFSVKQPMKCTYCNGENHVRETCFKLNGYPPKRKKKGKAPTGNYNFRTIPKALQSSVETSSSAQHDVSQLDHLQSQLNQVNNMMQMMLANKGAKSPEDHIHIAGPEPDENLSNW